jgi:RimJ/RimL family protein N-acetyltransferase
MELINDDVELRELQATDLELLMAWRSNPILYEWFYDQAGPLHWEEHYNWWINRRNRKDWIIVFNGEFKKRDVGSVNISMLNSDYPEIGIFVGEISLWGKGIAQKALEIAIEYLKNEKYSGATARVMNENIRSNNLFLKSGFNKVGMNEKGEELYKLTF